MGRYAYAKYTRPALAMALAAALAFGAPAKAASAPSKEYQVKAAFLFNFAHFAEWPDRAFSRPEDPFVIGVLGGDPFGGYLDEIVRDETFGIRPMKVKRFDRIEDVAGCQILFMGGRDLPPTEAEWGALHKRPILTVGESEAFQRAGGMIRFSAQRQKIRLKINVAAAHAAGLSISSKLLKLAEIVAPDKG